MLCMPQYTRGYQHGLVGVLHMHFLLIIHSPPMLHPPQSLGNDCLYRYRHTAEWVAPFIDIDEFVGPMPKSILPRPYSPPPDEYAEDIRPGLRVAFRQCQQVPAQRFELSRFGKLRIGDNLCVGEDLFLRNCSFAFDSEQWIKQDPDGALVLSPRKQRLCPFQKCRCTHATEIGCLN